MLVLIIGPSNVGKSSLAEYAGERVPNCESYDLDDLISRRKDKSVRDVFADFKPDGFLKLCRQEIDKLRSQCRNRLCLVVVGAGALESFQARDWLNQFETIAITATPEEVYRRDRLKEIRTFYQFKQTEYSNYRKSIYDFIYELLYSCQEICFRRVAKS